MRNINELIKRLCDYGIEKGLIEESDRCYTVNALLERLSLDSYTDVEYEGGMPLEEILTGLCDYAVERGIIADDTVTLRDLFDTSLMGILTPRPSDVIRKFWRIYKENPKLATDWFYELCRSSDYIREYRIIKDMKWTVPSEFGDIDITINLSKPEKDPKAIAAAKGAPQSGYPKCLLCHENEGFIGSVSKPARQTLRQIPLSVGGDLWYMQYSPYVYYNEHCILLSNEHTPMKISRKTFERMLDFITYLPHYMIGSNADLPIVGGSILTHDHMQGGCYTFAMERAGAERVFSFKGHEGVRAEIVHWPLSVIRLSSEDKEALIELSDKILSAWRGYTDEDAFIFAETDGEPHNTITPISRFVDGKFQIDLVLRNNITTKEHPLGVYHPHSELHNIKKENIGLIEVMGLAVLPSRLKGEMQALARLLTEGVCDISDNSELSKHQEWLSSFISDYNFSEMSEDEAMDALKAEIGKTFVKVLTHAGVYKCTPEGRAAFKRFTDYVDTL